MSEAKPFLFEIGTEELPPKSLKSLATVLEKELVSQLKQQKLIDGSTRTKVYATPRRLAVFFDAVLEKQTDQVIDRRGPAIKQAYDDQGKPTKAAIGFAKSVGLELDQVETQKTDKGEWLYCQINQPGKTAQELLPVCVENSLKALPIPKRMRWGNLQAEFIRPVKWLVMLLGSEVVEAQILSVQADRFTHGHRFHVVRKLHLRDASEYESLLEQEGMIVADFSKRRQQIHEQIVKLATEKNAEVYLDESLLDEVTGLVELPIACLGKIDQVFMDLPQEVLISSMQDHQKYFPLVDGNNKMLPYFITVSNIRSKDQISIIEGNEKVLRARLSDAQFFWNSDRRTPLADRKPMLDNVLFQQKLGSLADKSDRVGKLAVELAQQFGLDKDDVSRAAELSKLDLVTNMVGEFPELQGVMGRYYAINDGESPVVAQAIEEHYWPKFAGDQIPNSNEARVLAVADKLDTICGLFAIGQIPTGDRDPFGLRRAALGILRILIEGELDLDLRKAISTALAEFSELKVSLSTEAEIYNFIIERLKTLYQSQGFDTRLYQAVMEVSPDSPLDFDQRLNAVSKFTELESAESLIEANKRINNILQKANSESVDVDVAVLQEPEEKALFEQLQAVIEKSKPLLKDNRYADILKLVAQLKTSIDNFFDHVMVMDEDPAKRQNRLALLNQVRQLFRQVADVSFLK